MSRDVAIGMTRREMLASSALGFGWLASQAIAHGEATRVGLDIASRSPRHRPRAKSMIMLVQNGGPGQMDFFDPKPDLERFDGMVHKERVETFQKGSEENKLLKSPFQFHRRGQCGMELSEAIPHIGEVADELCLVRSMVSEHNNHTEGLVFLNTGKIFPGRPAFGSWVSYALGTENQNLPAYIVLRDPGGYNTSGTLLWQNGWLPALHRGTEVSTRGAPVLNMQPARPVDATARQNQLAALERLNRLHQARYPGDTELESRIRNYELAARMQMQASDTLNLSAESEATKKLYGLDREETAGYGRRCLMARNLIEAGVRFVQVFPPVKPQFQPWDAHDNTKTQNEQIAAKCDLPSKALIQDLKQRGLLDETIVLWSGEFGRLPVAQKGKGRDHNRNAFSLFLAGGGFKPGHIHGATDEIGYRAAQDIVTVHDLHATLLHQLGIDHKTLTYDHHNSPESLTDARVTNARVIRGLLV